MLAGHGKKFSFYLFDGKPLAGLEQGSEVLLIKGAALGRIGCCWKPEWRLRNQEAITVIQVRSGKQKTKWSDYQ